jgi:hypothetical protein
MSEKDFGCGSQTAGKAYRALFLIMLILLPLQSLVAATHAGYSEEFTAVLDVKVTGQYLLAGRANNLSIAIVNKGPSAASVVTVTLSIPTPLALMGKDDKWFFQVIGPGKNVTIEATVFAPEGSLGSTCSASLGLSYTADDYSETETRVISLTVHGFVDPWLSGVTFSPSPAVANRSLAVSGTITNEGSGTAKALSISIVSEPPFIATEASSLFIGDVSSGTSVAFSVTCNVANAKVGTYPLKFIISYEDDANTWSSKVVELNVTVVKGAGTTPGTTGQTRSATGLPILEMLVIGLVGLGAGVALTIILYRRRLLKVPEVSKKGA